MNFNRADIDRAIGGLYTVLSSTDMAHLSRTPIELWFEEGGETPTLGARAISIDRHHERRRHVTSVNALSQGLTRRFQFVYVGVLPKPPSKPTELELVTPPGARMDPCHNTESPFGSR